MRYRTRAAFILPCALILCVSSVLLATLLLQQAEQARRHRLAGLLHERAGAALRMNVAARVQRLGAAVLDRARASALQPAWPGSSGVMLPVAVDPETASPTLLASAAGPEPADNLAFASPVSRTLLLAGFEPWSPEAADVRMELAWAAEDVAVAGPIGPPPPGWPLPGWNLAPLPPAAGVPQLTGTAAAAWDGAWPPAGAPIPFLPDRSPDHVPVVTRLILRFGIFASGAVGSREKVVRLRFHLEGALWNPYNRQLALHGSSGPAPLFHLVFWNLPLVRLRNLSQGVTTGWMSMDEAANDGSGARGLQAWVRAPAALDPGMEWVFREPDARTQPEGLARTLHRGFMVGPADHVAVEFRPPDGGVYAACLQLDADDALAAARAGAGWFRAEGYPLALPVLDFPRADAAPRPFYIGDGSLAFRAENAHCEVGFSQGRLTLGGSMDPRRRRVRHGEQSAGPDGTAVAAGSIVAIGASSLLQQPERAFTPAPSTPLFSWPDSVPSTLAAAGDLAAWTDGFRIGSPAASRLNALLEEPSAWPQPGPDETATVTLADGSSARFGPAFPVNAASADYWFALLGGGAQTDPARFAAYPVPRAGAPQDFREWPRSALRQACERLAEGASREPARSVSDFFNRGLLPGALQPTVSVDPLHNLLPLRGWLRAAPRPRPRGAAWILHLAVRARQADLSFTRSARAWLVETGDASGPLLEVIRFEWTDPREHLRIPPR